MLIFMGVVNSSVSDFDIADLLESSPEISLRQDRVLGPTLEGATTMCFGGSKNGLKTPWEFCRIFSNLRNCMKVMKLRVVDLGVSKNRGTPKWIVYDGKPY